MAARQGVAKDLGAGGHLAPYIDPRWMRSPPAQIGPQAKNTSGINTSLISETHGVPSGGPFFQRFKGEGAEMIGYVGLFLSALIAATILPMQSEAVLVGLLLHGAHSVGALLLVATVGNVLGALINWYLGRFLRRYQDRRWFPVPPAKLARAEEWYRRFGRWSLLGSWLPVVGDPITIVAGVLREPLPMFLLLVTIAKAGRYLVLAAVALAWV